MIDDDIIEFLHSGCALLVGTVDEFGRPHAGRGLGLTVLDATAGVVRLLAAADEPDTMANLRPGAPVAITAASVRTLRSFQVKGHVEAVEPCGEADRRKQQQYTDDFIGDIHEVDGDAPATLQRWTDHPAVACVVRLDASFDQTPGPSAGSQVGARTA